MRQGMLASIGTLLASAGIGLAQQYLPPPQEPEPPIRPVAHVDKAVVPAYLPTAAPGQLLDNGLVTADTVNPPGGEAAKSGSEIQPVGFQSCGPGGCSSGDYIFDEFCGCYPQCWVSGEYLYWRFKDGPLAFPLVTTNPAAAGGGVLGSAGTAIAVGGNLDYGYHSGARIGAGICNASQTVGLEANAFWLNQRSVDFLLSSSGAGAPLLARPFINAVAPAGPAALLISSPGTLSGSVAVSSSSSLWGTEANLINQVCCRDGFSFDLLGGFRYTDLQEDLSIGQRSTLLTGAGGAIMRFNGAVQTAGTTLIVQDNFVTRNQFYGFQLGARGEFRFGRLYLDLLGKAAIGDMHQITDIQGRTTRIAGAASTVASGGLLALPSNIGRYTVDRFAFVPEGQANLGIEFTPNMRFYVGYDFMYMSSVVRPGSEINPLVNRTRIPAGPNFAPTGALQPVAPQNPTDFWVQGIHVGLAIRY